MKNNFKELFKFLINGGICFVIEYALTIIFTDICGFYYLISSTIAFLIATLINYIICVCWVFDINKDANKKQQIMFFITSLITLGLNQGLMYVGVSLFLINYKIMKIIATGIVTVVNYVFKKTIFTVKN